MQLDVSLKTFYHHVISALRICRASDSPIFCAPWLRVNELQRFHSTSFCVVLSCIIATLLNIRSMQWDPVRINTWNRHARPIRSGNGCISNYICVGVLVQCSIYLIVISIAGIYKHDGPFDTYVDLQNIQEFYKTEVKHSS